MKDWGKYIIGGVALVIVFFLCWYFSSIIAYILIAVVVSFLGRPISNLLKRIRIRGYSLSNTLRAIITVVCLWGLFILFFLTIIPLVAKEFKALDSINISQIVNKEDGPLFKLAEKMEAYGLIEGEEDVVDHVIKSLGNLVDVSKVKDLFGSVAGTVGGIFIALFSITFISFFFIKDSQLFSSILLAVMPARYEERLKNALESIQRLLVRYFVGIFLEVIIIMILNTVGLSIVGIGFSHALLIGLITGVLNVIPYIGPIIGVIFGLSIGVMVNIEMSFYTVIFPVLIYMAIVMILTQVVDNVLLQPLIYGNSVHAHPLEIFIVILMAGNLAGIPGMILAIPAYTVLRVILLEFFSEYKLVKSLTRGLENK